MPVSNAKTYVDFLTEFSAGMNGGVHPLLLPKNQVASSINCAFRGGYITTRPPFTLQTVNWPTPNAELVYETGVFQGSGYYRTDSGVGQLIVVVSGRIYLFVQSGDEWDATEITIAGDPLDSSATKVEMWQAEKWMIITDGSGSLPVFYDGTSCRRSYGDSELLGTITADWTSPAIGESVAVTLSLPYTGPFDVPVIVSQHYYQPVESPDGYAISLKSLSLPDGTVHTAGQKVMIYPSRVGYVVGAVTSYGVVIGGETIGYGQITLSDDAGMAVGGYITISGVTYVRSGTTYGPVDTPFQIIADIGVNQFTVKVDKSHVSSFTIPDGALVTKTYGAAANVEVGTLEDVFTAVIIGSAATAYINQSYTYPDATIVWINGNQFAAYVVPAAAASTTLYLINLSDTAGTNYAAGTGIEILSVPEIPACRLGAYGLSYSWVALTDGRKFIRTDVSGSPSGTVASDYRDAVLKTTENSLGPNEGAFSIPVAGETINAIWFVPTLDASLGLGSAQVGTDTGIFSVNAPLDRDTWDTLDYPILTQTLKGNGPISQKGTVLANSDTFFRSPEGECSLILARRDFQTWGNTPASAEVDNILADDERSLLPYSNAIVFDNRLVYSANPEMTASGITHDKLITIDFEPLTNLRGKLPAIYEGYWYGLNVLQVITGFFDGVKEAYAFTHNSTDNTIELVKIGLTDSSHFDNEDDRITFTFETPIIFNKDVKPLTELIRLTNGELYLEDIEANTAIDITVEYRPDFNQTWNVWKTFTLAASTSTYRMRIGLGEPSASDCDSTNNRPLRVGNFFQVKFTITGHCKFMAAKFMASVEQEQALATPIC